MCEEHNVVRDNIRPADGIVGEEIFLERTEKFYEPEVSQQDKIVVFVRDMVVSDQRSSQSEYAHVSDGKTTQKNVRN